MMPYYNNKEDFKMGVKTIRKNLQLLIITASSAVLAVLTGCGGDSPTGSDTYYTVTYNGNGNTGGTVPVDPDSPYKNGASVKVLGPGTSLTRTGYMFSGWNTVADGSGVSYAEGYRFDITSNTTLFAKWTATYAVTVSSAGTGASGSGSYPQGATVSISAGTPPYGQQFKNWTTESNGVAFANASSVATTFTMPANAVTVTVDFDTVGTFTDSRDGRTYKTVVISGQRWMAENINYETDSSWCHSDNPFNCVKYGRLYTFDAAKTVCPAGWHLPAFEEWRVLIIAAGGTANEWRFSEYGAENLKSDSWDNGKNLLGFSALPGGNRNPSGSFSDLDMGFGAWWTAEELDSTSTSSLAYYRYMITGSAHVGENHNNRNNGMSVRCVQD
jgi:uncharacterized protein (TIGR02145 family)